MDRDLVEHLNRQWICVYVNFCASLESNICMANSISSSLVSIQNEMGTDLWLSRTSDTENSVRLHVGFQGSELKLYCRYLYTRPCMINHIWGLKQLWLQVNGHAWFHLQRLRWPVRNGEKAKNSKWKYMSPAGFEPTPRQSTTGKLQRLRPLGHAG